MLQRPRSADDDLFGRRDEFVAGGIPAEVRALCCRRGEAERLAAMRSVAAIAVAFIRRCLREIAKIVAGRGGESGPIVAVAARFRQSIQRLVRRVFL